MKIEKNKSSALSRLNWVWNIVKGPRLAPRLKEAHKEIILSRTRTGSLIAGPVYILGTSIYDYLFFPEIFFIGLWVAGICALAALLVYFSLGLKFFQEHYQLPLVIILAIISNVAITTNLQLTGGGAGFFLFPYLLIFIAVPIYFPGTFFG